MKKNPITQYLPLTRPKASRRFLNKLNSSNVSAILDLEDSAQNIFDFEETCILKEEARNGLLSISSTFESPYKSPIYIRVNSMDTQFFEEDIKTILQSSENNIPITGIFLPKVRDYSQILTLNEILSDGDYNLEIVPMIETVKGYGNISNILNEDKNYNLISRVHYGHFDYCLDAGLWPFPDPFHFEYWEIVQNLVGIVHGYGKTYVHTPFPFPQDEQLFWWTTNKLQKLSPNGESVMCTVNTGLSLSAKPNNITDYELYSVNTDTKEILLKANNIIKNFLSGRAIKRSFGVKDNRFIPPHQYLAAKRFIENNEN